MLSLPCLNLINHKRHMLTELICIYITVNKIGLTSALKRFVNPLMLEPIVCMYFYVRLTDSPSIRPDDEATQSVFMIFFLYYRKDQIAQGFVLLVL